ncbi:MAG: flagellar basal body rod protein FlgB [Acidobacteria bacterium]|nr:flagellar basal body rod protein FlgB [Acidobacteriota bacterium]
MDAITDSAIMAALGRYMNRAVVRESVAAGNLANVDTPDYRTREASFAEALGSELADVTVVRTAPGHLAGAVRPSGAAVGEADGLPIRRDGNNVQMDRELVSLTRATADFSAAQTALAAKFRLVRYAINEGR